MTESSPRTILAAARDAIGGAIVRDAALPLARAGQDRLVLAHVEHLADWQRVFELMTPAWMHEPGSRAEDPSAWLQRLAEVGRAQGQVIDTHVLEGAPGSALVDQAKAVQAGLIVVATPREDRVREFFLGSTALSILRDAPCPVLLARGLRTKPVKQAMIAVVPESGENRLAEAAASWFPEARMHFAHCFELPEEGQLRIHGYTEAAISKYKQLLRQEAERKLAPLRAAYPDASIQIENGYAASTLLELLGQRQPDMLVLGAHRGTRVGERFLGSVAQFMVYNAEVDLLLVP